MLAFLGCRAHSNFYVIAAASREWIHASTIVCPILRHGRAMVAHPSSRETIGFATVQQTRSSWIQTAA